MFLLADEGDLQDVRSKVADLAGTWKDLGISLGISWCKLDAIHSHSPRRCLTDACTVAKAKLQCKDYPYSQILSGKGLDTCKIYLMCCISAFDCDGQIMCLAKKKKKEKRKIPLPLKSVYTLIPRLTRHFVALKLYIYSLLPTLGFPHFLFFDLCSV